MKPFLKKTLQRLLFQLAQAILRKYHPKVIGITGSIGKSTTKEAVFAVLKNNFRIRSNLKNYNNEIGLPLTIIGQLSAGQSLSGWLVIFFSALKLILLEDKTYPEILILEMGIDRPGDMEYLIKLAPVDIGIITNVGPVHLEYFKTLEKIAKEKATLVTKLKAGGRGVLNLDNEQVANMKNSVKGRFLTYGLSSEANVRALEVALSYKREGVIAGTSFKLAYDGKVVPVFLQGVLAEHLVGAALAAACVGIILQMNLIEIAEALQDFAPPLGRMHLLEGINETQIIDDTYNASPEAMIAAVRVLGQIETSGRKIAVLGDMLELGDYEKSGHEAAGKAVAEARINLLVVVGDRARLIANAAVQNGYDGAAKFFPNSLEAGEYLLSQIQPGDLLLVKGSQGMRMERTVKALLAKPELASSQLVRQDESWLNKR